MNSRILIVRLGALGDIVHAIPVAAALRRAFPTARIDWLVSARHRELLDLVPVIDRRLVINDRLTETGLRTAGRGDLSPITPMLAAIRELRRARYDVALDLQGLLKSAVLARASGAARVVGFSSAYVRERLARLFYTETREPEGVPHVVFQNLALLQALDLTVVSPEFPIERVDSAVAAQVRDGPWAADDVTVSRHAVCQCHHLRRCRLATTCLLDIGVDEVVGAVERRLACERSRV